MRGIDVQASPTVQVSTFNEFKDAINSTPVGDSVEIDVVADFTVTDSSVWVDGCDVKVISTKRHTITIAATAGVLIDAVTNGGTLTLGEGLIVDCNEQPRVAQASTNSTVIVDGATVKNAKCSGYDVVFSAYASGAKFIMKKGAITDCKSTTTLGVVAITNGAMGEISGGYITNCDASQGYAPVYVSQSKLTISGGEIRGNKGSWGGGVMCLGGQVEMTGGSIIGNKATYSGGGVYCSGGKLAMSGGVVKGCSAGSSGGGVYVYSSNGEFEMTNGSIEGNTATNYGGGVGLDAGAKFALDGGTIKGNTASSGGGLYVGNTTNVELKAGRIEYNEAKTGNSGYGTGGGIVVASNTKTATCGLHMSDVLITENHAGTVGGGAWLCPTGMVDSEISDGVAMYGNTADQAADDLAITIYKDRSEQHTHDVIQSRMLGGGIAERYHDGSLVAAGYTEDQYSVSGNSIGRYSEDNKVRFNYETWNGTESIALHNEASDNAKQLATQRAKLFITHNTADMSGGGIGSNGNLKVGKSESKKVTVKKVWGLPTGTSALAEVRVKLEIDGAEDGEAREVEEIVLNAANNWTHTFEGIPVKAKVNLEEAAVSAQGWVTYYKEGFSNKQTISDPDTDETGTEQTEYYELETVDVTNAREGSLSISKVVDGNQADPDQEFKFQVTIVNPDDPLDEPIVDEQSGEKLLYAPYEGRDAQHHSTLLDFPYSGSSSGTLVGGSGTITLKAGETVTVTGLPHGAEYHVREVASTADGYEIMPCRDDGTVGHKAETGTITGDKTTTLAYTNLKGDRVGSLKVSKAVSGNAADSGQLFHFQVRFYHADGSELSEGEFAYVGSHEGVIASGGMFALKGGESIHIDGIPTDTRWTVKEVVADAHGYEVEPACGDLRGENAEEGVIETGKTVELAYTNVKESTMGTLAVSKTVESGNASRAFEFKLTFTDSAGEEVRYGEFAYTGAREGFVESGDTITLAHGERVVIEGLPAGTKYQVREVNASGYEATYDGAEGTVASGAAAEAKIVNKLAEDEPATGDESGGKSATSPSTGDGAGAAIAPAVAACLLAALVAAVALVMRRRA